MGLVGNAPRSEKNEVSYLQTNNLENLIRNKRQNSNKIFGILKNVIDSEEGINLGVSLNNKIYFVSATKKIHEHNPEAGEQKVVVTANSDVESPGVAFNNKLYFASNNGEVFEYDTQTNYQRTVIDIKSESFVSSGVVLNNKIYFASNKGNLYQYDSKTKQQEMIININIAGAFTYSGVVLNNKIYFGLSNNNVYEYNPETKKHKSILNTNGNIYNYELVVLNNKIYFGSNDRVYEYDYFDLNESDIIINMEEQIRIGLYLHYKKQNPNYEVKDILNIFLKNLTTSDVTIEQNQKNETLNLEDELNFCPQSNSTFTNNTDSEQTQNTISCSKQLTETNTIQKMNGFYKSESTADNDNWNAKWGGKFTFKATGSAGIPLVAEGKVEAEFEVSHENSWGKSRTETITDTSNSSDTEIKTTTNTTTITVPSQPVKIPPHSKISISVITWKNNIKIILNISQKVEGMVSANFIDKNNNENIVNISIKDAMISLLENEILPSKIKINNDDSISFSYDTEIKIELIMHQTEIGEAIPVSLDEQNISFKNNTTSIIVEKNKV